MNKSEDLDTKERHCMSSASSEEILTSDDLFNDIINVAYSLESDDLKKSETLSGTENCLSNSASYAELEDNFSNQRHCELADSFHQLDLEDSQPYYQRNAVPEISKNANGYNSTSKEPLHRNTEHHCSNEPDLVPKSLNMPGMMSQCTNEPGMMSQCTNEPDMMSQCTNEPGMMKQCLNESDLMPQCSNEPDLVPQALNEPDFVPIMLQYSQEEENDCFTDANINFQQNLSRKNNIAKEAVEKQTVHHLEDQSANGGLSRASSKSSFSDASIASSRTSSESGLADYNDDYQEESCEGSYSKDPSRLTRPKSHSLASTQSEMDFVLNHEKEKRFARMSLERDKRPPLYSGFLIKLGGTGFTPKNWRKRWFLLKKDNCLYYFKDPKNDPVGAVVLCNYLVTTVAMGINKKFAFQLTKGGARSYIFAALSDIERRTWMKVIAEAAKVPDRIPTSPETSIHNVSIPALSIKDPDCHGYLWKQGYSHKTWKRRYSVLKSGCLYYYQDMSETVALGIFNLRCYTIQETESSSRKYSFVAIPPQSVMRTYYFSAESPHDRDRWTQAMIKSIEAGEEEEQYNN